MDIKLDLFSSAMKLNTQYMHIQHFYLKLKRKTNMQSVLAKFEANDRIALTDKINSNEVFSLVEIMDILEEY